MRQMRGVGVMLRHVPAAPGSDHKRASIAEAEQKDGVVAPDGQCPCRARKPGRFKTPTQTLVGLVLRIVLPTYSLWNVRGGLSASLALLGTEASRVSEVRLRDTQPAHAGEEGR